MMNRFAFSPLNPVFAGSGGEAGKNGDLNYFNRNISTAGMYPV